MAHLFQLGVGMLRAIVVVGFIVGLISVIVFGPSWLQTTDNKTTDTDQPACDLHAGPCGWETKSGRWQVELETMGDKGQGTEYRLRVNAPTTPDRFLAVLRGESMYMGEYPVPLRIEKEGIYSAHFTAPLCTTGSEMVWRIDLQAGQNALSEPAPMKLTFQAQDNQT
ncbi:hypothetical protein [Marinobacter sp.]|uniref:hypothetical protein n=1 Tax=Marinobacter sp. TaxID=50741 RepID=UPI003A93DBE7